MVAAASEEAEWSQNGMSRFARDGRNANSAIALDVMPVAQLDFQRKLERAAFSAAGGNYNAPVQTVGDFLTGKHGSEPSRVKPSYMGGDRYTLCDLHNILPSDICDMLTAGLADFGRKLKGFDAPDAVLTGVESRTSAPYRILRSENYISPAANNFYPCGEGAGYAGGITSAATDGLSCALAVMKRIQQPTAEYKARGTGVRSLEKLERNFKKNSGKCCCPWNVCFGWLYAGKTKLNLCDGLQQRERRFCVFSTNISVYA